MSQLYKAHSYLCKDIPFIISSYIREYDIAKANINILYKYGVLDKKQYDYYHNCPRMEREIAIGNLQKSNPKITKILQDGITEAKRLFFEANDIQDYEVLAIKNDAIFLVNKIAQTTIFDNIEFKNKNVYTSYYNLGKCELYYYYNEMDNIESIDIKGIRDKLYLHKEYFLDFLLTAFQTIQVGTLEETIDLMNAFYTQYINYKLDKGYYREFNSMSMYRTKKFTNLYEYTLDNIRDSDLKYIDISYNLNIIRQLMSYFSTLSVAYVKNHRNTF